MREKLKNISGVTLIELLIGIVITTIIMGAMYTTYNGKIPKKKSCRWCRKLKISNEGVSGPVESDE